MSWKTKKSSRYGFSAADWKNSSGDDSQDSTGRSWRREVQAPAENSQEAIWRAAKRVSAAFRWLRIDLALLAQDEQHSTIIDAISTSLLLMGNALLPDLGKIPVKLNSANRTEVMELVGLLCSLRQPAAASDWQKSDSRAKSTQHEANEAGKRTCSIACQTEKAVSRNRKSLPTNGPHMVRFEVDELVGCWIPLTVSSIRRKCIIRCKEKVLTNTEGVHNYEVNEGDLCQVHSIDGDNDAQVVILEKAGFQGLWCATDRRWLLSNCYSCFDTWIPCDALDRHKENIEQRSKQRESVEEGAGSEFP